MALKLPQFIQELDQKPNRYYGTIEYGDWRNVWIITAEDHVAELYRRIFKSTRNFHSNNVYLPNNKRIISDINWILLASNEEQNKRKVFKYVGHYRIIGSETNGRKR